MKEQNRHREEHLDRWLEHAGPASFPTLEPDPGLPDHIRALAARDRDPRPAGWSRPRWGWISLASAACALSILLGGYIGYHAWASSQPATASVQSSDADMLMAAWAQSGFVEDLSQLGQNSGVSE
ncbi:MAG TPA: hypothetical protein VFH88_14295 [Candidatus Krumholzibacteria bacterium]|nr:hypothetical protein [Candidatus Krumholzibacteria bacterium]